MDAPAAGLPSGMKWDAQSQTISGVPVKAGSYTVVFNASKPGEANQTATITLNIEALPAWASGTFTGYAKPAAKSAEGGLSESGLFTMTVSQNGKISGKISMSGTNWTFTAASYAERSTVAGAGAFYAEARMKAGRETAQLAICVGEIPGGASGSGLADATVAAEAELYPLDSDIFLQVEARRNAWKDKQTAATAKNTAAQWEGVYAIAVDDGYFSATVGRDGNMKAAGKLPDGTAISVSTTLACKDGGGMTAFIYAAPSAYKGGSFAAKLDFAAPHGSISGDKTVSGWINRNPLATTDYGAGFRRSPVLRGAYYGKPAGLREYYENRRIEFPSVPVLEYAFKETYLDAAGRKVSQTSPWMAAAAESAGQDYSLALNAAGTAFALPAATRPVQDRSTKEWFYNGANDGALTFSANKATGVFKGSFTFWYDYISACDYTTGRETPVHASKRVNFEGIAVPGRDYRGFFLRDATGSYIEPATGMEKTYRSKESIPVAIR